MSPTTALSLLLGWCVAVFLYGFFRAMYRDWRNRKAAA